MALSSTRGASSTEERNLFFEDLDECLSSITVSGSFSIFEPLISPPNPGLWLQNGGTIGLPLSERDAETIVLASHRAPYGKGEETIVDETVRKTWELSPSDFKLRNPAWEPFLKMIVKKVSAGLGVDSIGDGVTAELYKLLLYDEGAMFKAHKDSEKVPRMFGTLVIALPSQHQGGEVRVSHAGETRILNTSTFSEFNCSFLSWFSDVTHEIQPVRSGHRLVLTYNLIHTKFGPKELSAGSNITMERLNEIFDDKERTNSPYGALDPRPMMWVLEHKYTSSALSYDILKGHDQHVVSYLRDVCAKHLHCIYLATIKRTVCGYAEENEYGYCGYSRYDRYDQYDSDPSMIEETSSDVSLIKVLDLDGTEMAQDVELCDGDNYQKFFIQGKDVFDDLEPDDKDVEYTGNEGVSATYSYLSTAVIIIPKKDRFKFLLSFSSGNYGEYDELGRNKYYTPGNPRVGDWLGQLAERLRQNSEDFWARKDFEQIARLVTEYMIDWKAHRSSAPRSYSDDVLITLFTMALEFSSIELIEEIYKVAFTTLSADIYSNIGAALHRFELYSLLPKLSLELRKVSSLADRLSFLVGVRNGLESESKSSGPVNSQYKEWLDVEAALSIEESPPLSARDGEYLVKISKVMSSQDIFNRVLPAVKKGIEHIPLVTTFIAGIYNAGLSDDTPKDVANSLLRDLISDFADVATLQGLCQRVDPPIEKKVWSYYGSRKPPPTQPLILKGNSQAIDVVATLLLACQVLGLSSELERLVRQLETKEISHASSDLLEAIYLPSLKSLTEMAQAKGIIIDDPMLVHLIHVVLVSYFVKFVKTEPTLAEHQRFDLVECKGKNCKDCPIVNRFLRDGQKHSWTNELAQTRRNHVITQIKRMHDVEFRVEGNALTIIKGQAKYHSACGEWQQRRVVAQKHLKEFGPEFLEQILGREFDSIASIDMHQLMATTGILQEQSHARRNEGVSYRELPPPPNRKIPKQPTVIVLDDSD